MAKKKEVLNLPIREIYVHEYVGKIQKVRVCILIDYGKRTISIVDSESACNSYGREVKTKKYIFSGREIEYMMGWHDIMDGTKSAITHAEAKLKEYIKESDDKEMELLLAVEKAIKK